MNHKELETCALPRVRFEVDGSGDLTLYVACFRRTIGSWAGVDWSGMRSGLLEGIRAELDVLHLDAWHEGWADYNYIEADGTQWVVDQRRFKLTWHSRVGVGDRDHAIRRLEGLN